jgi:UDPglucose--hexose-1-phosphate uridylyltransferase
MDFKFIENKLAKKWVILAPRRAKRPDEASGVEPGCPFCETQEKEAFKIDDEAGKWLVKVVSNKFPFAPIHEIIIHSPDHHKNFDELPLSQSELIFKAYRQRFKTHKSKGSVYIFHNHGEAAGESLRHPHSQLTVTPDFVKLEVPPVNFSKEKEESLETNDFIIFAPISSEWPDEVWIMPKKRETFYDEITDDEIKDLSKAIHRVIQLLDLRHDNEFPFNFYISPFKGWYLRIIPRIKRLGGFELGTGLGVNTQDPKETIMFIKEHFESPDHEKIKTHHQATYKKAV